MHMRVRVVIFDVQYRFEGVAGEAMNNLKRSKEHSKVGSIMKLTRK